MAQCEARDAQSQHWLMEADLEQSRAE